MSVEEFEDFLCPYCGGNNALAIDLSGGNRQSFVVDCEVCCAPIAVIVKISAGRVIAVDVRQENE